LPFNSAVASGSCDLSRRRRELSLPLGHICRLVDDKHHRPPHTETMRRRLASIEIFWTPGRRDRLAFDRLVLFGVVLAVYPSRD